jgi:hypothetical protein
VKQTSAHPKIKAFTGSQAGSNKQPGSHRLPNGSHAKSEPNPNPTIDDPNQDRGSPEESELKRIKELPKEVGVMLITAGIVGFILPGPGTPAIIAGGLALWPTAFGKLESWLERRHPEVHRQSMKQIGRFLDDLETRYPYTGHD